MVTPQMVHWMLVGLGPAIGEAKEDLAPTYTDRFVAA